MAAETAMLSAQQEAGVALQELPNSWNTESFPGISLYQWGEAIDANTAEHFYQICFCEHGLQAFAFHKQWTVLHPGQFLISRYDAQTAPPLPMTGWETGLTLLIDAQRVPHDLLAAFGNGNVVQLLKQLTGETDVCICKDPHIESLFQAMLTESLNNRKLRIIELFLSLQSCDLSAMRVPAKVCSDAQIELVAAVCKDAMSHLHEHLTIQALSERADVSPTHLKESFRAVCDDSLYSFIRAQKMQIAAHMLRTTSYRVIDIASEVGYDNCSKFAKAFSDVMGMAPNVYRKSVRLEHHTE